MNAWKPVSSRPLPPATAPPPPPPATADAGGGSCSFAGMAIAVVHCQDMKPPAARCCHCRPRSVAQLERPDHQERNGGLSPRRRSLSSPCFTTAAPAAGDPHTETSGCGGDKTSPRVEIVAGRHARGVHELIAEAASAIASGTRLVPAQGGLGGALVLNDGRSGEHVAIIKPLDDSAAAAPLGSGYASKAVLREVAAFLLDHGGFARVEPTALIKISRPGAPTTMASIQRFVAHEYDAGELGPSRFSVASVHRVGILDVRLLNIDRHAGNILVKKPPPPPATPASSTAAPPLELVPIDHGLCLPEQLEDPYFEWLHWPQSSLPFSHGELEYVAALDPFRDAEMLRAELPALTEPAIRILTLCTIFLQRAAAAGLCLADIGDMMTREFSALEEGLSALEALCKKAADSIAAPQQPSTGADNDDCLGFILAGDGDMAKSRGGARRRMSFRELSTEQWAAFLERFEHLLPAAVEAKKRAGLKLATLGTSF